MKVSSPLVLASSSPRRVQIMESIGLHARVMASDADESFDASSPPADIVMKLAKLKVETVARRISADGQTSIVIGADTIVVVDGYILGKPVDRLDALHMLNQLQGRQHEVYTGVTLVDAATGRTLSNYRMTKVWMKGCESEALRRYVDTGEPMDKAGAYAIQGLGAKLVESIEGCFYNVVGMPVSLLCDMLTEFGIEV